MADFSDVHSAVRTLERLRLAPLRTLSGWDLAHVLLHVAQSVDCSIDGFPQVKPAWFRATMGSAAFALFSVRGMLGYGEHFQRQAGVVWRDERA